MHGFLAYFGLWLLIGLLSDNWPAATWVVIIVALATFMF